MQRDNIKIKGHNGTWYIIDETIRNGKNLFLVESEQHGDESAAIIIDKDCNVILDDVWNGFDDYDESEDIA